MPDNNIFTKDDLKEIYDLHFKAIRNFVYFKTKDVDIAEDLAQDVFVKLWSKRETIRKETVKSLLYTMAGNMVINHFNHMKVVYAHETDTSRYGSKEMHTPQFLLEEKEYEQKLNEVLEMIPDGCREVFLMNRIEKMKYDEIASRLELSVKAVEKRMSKALAIIREELGRKL
ncbi:MAG: RNA polymerase sigma-70 factor [bacterium]|jgi:RNA polymerase sigma-70 factor (family 1)|nr:RNA polymerase sigma-70 factor [bacterium]